MHQPRQLSSVIGDGLCLLSILYGVKGLWLDLDCVQKFVFFEALAGPCVNPAAQLQLITFSFFDLLTTLHCVQLTLET